MEYIDFIEVYNIKKIDTINYTKALEKLYISDYDGIEYTEIIILNKKQEYLIKLDDIIYNIKCDKAFLYYIVNEKVYPIESHTRFITACCPFTNIYIGVITDTEDTLVKINRIILKTNIRDEMICKVVEDNNFKYYMNMLSIRDN